MTTTTLSTSRPAAAEAVQTKAASRLLFIDNIRVFLTILVILHHLMIMYAGSGSFLYNEGRQDTLTAVLGTWFCAVNQAYFMGFFLLIAAYFVPGSYDRKGAGHFLKDRLIRLGIPLVVYSWIISPLTWVVITYVTLGQLLPLSDYLPGGGSKRSSAAGRCGLSKCCSSSRLSTWRGGGSSGPTRLCRQCRSTAAFPAARSLCSSRCSWPWQPS